MAVLTTNLNKDGPNSHEMHSNAYVNVYDIVTNFLAHFWTSEGWRSANGTLLCACHPPSNASHALSSLCTLGLCDSAPPNKVGSSTISSSPRHRQMPLPMNAVAEKDLRLPSQNALASPQGRQKAALARCRYTMRSYGHYPTQMPLSSQCSSSPSSSQRRVCNPSIDTQRSSCGLNPIYDSAPHDSVLPA